jgi:hypothetical protein
MKFQTLTVVSVSLFLYSAAFTAPEVHAATAHHAVVSGVHGGHSIQSSPLELLKVNGVEGTSMGIVRDTAARPSQIAVQAATDAEPGTLTMLLRD